MDQQITAVIVNRKENKLLVSVVTSRSTDARSSPCCIALFAVFNTHTHTHTHTERERERERERELYLPQYDSEIILKSVNIWRRYG